MCVHSHATILIKFVRPLRVDRYHMYQLPLERAIHSLVLEALLRELELLRIIWRDLLLPFKRHCSDDLLDRFPFPQKCACGLQANSRNAWEIVASAEDGHCSELYVRPVGERDVGSRSRDGAKFLPGNGNNGGSIGIEFEEDVLASKYEEVRVFSKNRVHNPNAF